MTQKGKNTKAPQVFFDFIIFVVLTDISLSYAIRVLGLRQWFPAVDLRALCVPLPKRYRGGIRGSEEPHVQTKTEALVLSCSSEVGLQTLGLGDEETGGIPRLTSWNFPSTYTLLFQVSIFRAQTSKAGNGQRLLDKQAVSGMWHICMYVCVLILTGGYAY